MVDNTSIHFEKRGPANWFQLAMTLISAPTAQLVFRQIEVEIVVVGGRAMKVFGVLSIMRHADNARIDIYVFFPSSCSFVFFCFAFFFFGFAFSFHFWWFRWLLAFFVFVFAASNELLSTIEPLLCRHSIRLAQRLNMTFQHRVQSASRCIPESKYSSHWPADSECH